MRVWLACARGLVLCAGLALPALAMARLPAVVQTHSQPETLARDLREEVVRIQATVKDAQGREQSLPLPITIYRPAGGGPFPVVVLNHGRAPGDKRALQTRFRPEAAARYFVAKGFVVLAPTRIGYWETYASGFDPENPGRCVNLQVQAVSEAASQEVLAAMEFAKLLIYADTSRWLVAGQSVGGLTAVATVGRAPAGLLGGINFSGGIGGDPERRPANPCNPQAEQTYWASLGGQARAPMLWLYWQNDRYWGDTIPRQWHQAWEQGGGRAQYASLAAFGADGHDGFAGDMDHWLPVVDAFLASLGFNKRALITVPPPSGFAPLDDVGKLPSRNPTSRQAYARYLSLPNPRAFALGGDGWFGYAQGDYAAGRALGNCQHFNGEACKLYAVDDQVVWVR
jgi:dienelactone hydrolase